ncbi:hypothetical protein ACH4U6_27240 [Streptomyces netropsis]|uniref:hypothetical protein n=1 Tax=Streptomyces netropsis TaxID=55404 RepID=UPI0037A833D3
MDDKGESEAKPKNKRLELSVAQVAGSALAACIAALLAGKLGVYGTIIGAGVVSVVATTGGTIFQHLFKRTGEKITEATVQAAKPKLRQVPVRDAGRAIENAAGRAGGERHNGWSGRDADATTVMPAADGPRPGMPDPDRTRLLRQAEATQMLPEIDATQALHQAGPSAGAGAHAGAHSGAGSEPHPDQHADTFSDTFGDSFNDTFSDGTTHGTRLRGWKRPLLAAGAVFVLAMGTVTAVELVQGSSADGGGGTTVGQIFQPQKPEKKPDRTPSQTPDPGHSQGGGGQESGTGGSSPSPDSSQQGGGGTDHSSPDPQTSPSSGGSTPTPKPTPPTEPSGTPDSGKGDDGAKDGTTNGGAATGGGQTPPPPQGQQNAAAGAGSGS